MVTVYFEGSSGVQLAADVTGPWNGRPVVLLHGGGQTRHSWGGTSRALAERGYLALALDARGHGDSDWSKDSDYSIDAYVGDLRAVLAQLGRPAALVGASLGGLTSLLARGEQPMVDSPAIVLVDVTPRMQPDGRRRITEFMRGRPEGFATVEEAADAVSAYLPNRPRPKDVSGLVKNLRLGPDGRYRWHWDPAFAEGTRLMNDTARPERFEAAAAAITAPMLLVRGSISEVVADEDVQALRTFAPDMEFVDVEGASHMVAGDRNDVFAAATIRFLERHY
ncbi:alpha/beta hydrolase [Nocardia sp. BSTN01]|nr:alpha/beta hydrolase [Nocardia sp. BSTN01]